MQLPAALERGRTGEWRRAWFVVVALCLSLALAPTAFAEAGPSSSPVPDLPPGFLDRFPVGAWVDYDVPARFGEPSILGLASPRPLAEQIPGPSPADGAPWSVSIRCAILYAHDVPSRRSFAVLLQGLVGAGYQPTSLRSVEDAMAGRAPRPDGCLVLTFDDGLSSQFENALPVLKQFDVPGVFFVMPAFADGVHRYMTAREIESVRRAGHEVMAHTCNHADLPTLAAVNRLGFLAELSDCKTRIENIVHATVPYLAYPNGSYNADTVQATHTAGYRAAFTTRAAALLPAGQPYALPRIRFDAWEAPDVVLERIRKAGG